MTSQHSPQPGVEPKPTPPKPPAKPAKPAKNTEAPQPQLDLNTQHSLLPQCEVHFSDGKGQMVTVPAKVLNAALLAFDAALKSNRDDHMDPPLIAAILAVSSLYAGWSGLPTATEGILCRSIRVKNGPPLPAAVDYICTRLEAILHSDHLPVCPTPPAAPPAANRLTGSTKPGYQRGSYSAY